MNFEIGHLYHIYNQGNNRQKIFFEDRNYAFFLEKVKKHILPHCDIFAYCLMPNHFHLMVRVNTVVFKMDTEKNQERTLSNSIAIMLRSYTRAINIQEKTTGSLFRAKTKAVCLTDPLKIPRDRMRTSKGLLINREFPEFQHPQLCFDYIHQNPVKSGLVQHAQDWIYSSAKIYILNSKDELVNRQLAMKYIPVYD